MTTAPVDIPRSQQVLELRRYIDGRIAELRETLEDERLDDEQTLAVATRHRLNELKDILDRFRLPAA